jgi:hypothetical protein
MSSPTGMPDGLFSNLKSKLGYILEGLAMKNVGINMSICSILLPLEIFYGH